MKKFLFVALLLLFTGALAATAQNRKAERQADRAQSREEREMNQEIRSKAIKQARKEAKKYAKQGFQVTPGSLAMDKMLEKTWYKQLEEDAEGQIANLVGDGNAVAETRTAAEMQAMEMAKLALAGQLQSLITGMVKANIGNAQLNNEEAASVTKVLTASKNFISAKLSRIDPVFKIYRNLSNKNVEVNVKIFYNKAKAMDMAKSTIREEMEKEMQQMHGKLDKLLDIEDKPKE